jgi:hypothetical protein
LNRHCGSFAGTHAKPSNRALDALEEAGQMPAEFSRQHQTGDWGELCEADKKGELLFSH